MRAAVIAGAAAGAIFGGVGGRTAMRVVALVDGSADGARTDFGATVGEMTVGGTITLTVITMLAGVFGGVLYVAIRRWLPWSGVARGLVFGVLMVFGPGIIAVGETDLQIFRPALPIFLMFASLELMYAVFVALTVDRLHPAAAVRPGRRSDLLVRGIQCVAAAAVFVFAVALAMHIVDGEGTCLTAGEEGGCGFPGQTEPRQHNGADVPSRPGVAGTDSTSSS